MEIRKPDTQPELSDDDHALNACSQDLIDAVHAKDTKRTSDALRSAFELLGNQPQDQGTNEQEEME